MAKIPALTLSGGKLSEFGGLEALKEVRIWIHPQSGDDYYYRTEPANLKRYFSKWRSINTTKGGKQWMKKEKINRVERPLGVVWDKNHKKYREVVIDNKYIMRKRRATWP